MGEKIPTSSPWRPFPGAACSWMNASWGRDLHGQFMKICSLWEGLIWENFIEDCFLWKLPFAGAGEEEWGETLLWVRKEQQRWHVNWPQPPFAVPLRGEERENLGVNLSLRRGEVRGRCFQDLVFPFFLSCSDLISNKFNWFSHVKSGLPMMVGAEQSPCPYLDPWALLYFLSLVQLKSGVINGFDGHLISSQGHPSTLLYLRAAPNARSRPLKAQISQHAVTRNCSWTSIFHLVFFLWS